MCTRDAERRFPTALPSPSSQTMELMQCMAKEPLHLTYRAVGSSTGQKEFVGPDDKARGVPRQPVRACAM